VPPEGNTLYFDCFGVHAELTPGNTWNDYLVVGNVLVGERVGFNPLNDTGTASYYSHADHLNSISVITDAYGNVVQRLSYDAWGNSRLPNGADGEPSEPPTTRGFTSQEELTVSGLVHLNGRVYDPMFGRIISADPTVPGPLLLRRQ
jgi:RHS repeat-associated protein